jgi:hypothetical protein
VHFKRHQAQCSLLFLHNNGNCLSASLSLHVSIYCLKYSKKKSQGTLSSRFSFCSPTILLFCPGAHNPCLLFCYQFYNVNRQGFNVSLAMRHFNTNLLWQKCRGSRKWSLFSTLERFPTLCHTFQNCKCSTPSH